MSRSLILLSTSVKNVRTLSKYVTFSRLCHNINEHKDIQVKEDVLSTKELFIKLENDHNPLSLLSTIEANKNNIDARHIVTALTSMQKFYNDSGISPSDVHKSVHFHNICSILKKNLITLDLPQVIQAVKVLNLLKVPSCTIIMQSLLQLIRHSINDISLQQIFYLSFLLRRMTPTPLIEAILQALPEVFVSQLEFQLDKDDIKELKNSLWYASRHVNNGVTINYLIDALINNQNTLDVDSALLIHSSLCNLKVLPDNCRILLNKVEDILLNNAGLLQPLEIKKSLLKILSKLLRGQEEFYNPILIDRFIDKLVTQECSFNDGLFILNKLNIYKHVNVQLVHYLSSVCIENPMILSTCKPINIHVLVMGLVIANYKPHFWKKLQKLFLNKYKSMPDDVTLTYFALNLLSLDCFDSELLNHIFSLDINPKLISPAYHKTLQQLYQSVKTLYPTYTGPWFSKELIQSFESLTESKSKVHPLHLIIEKVVGGPAYIHTNVKTNLGQIIDYLVILQDGCPVAVKLQFPLQDSSSVPCIDDFDIPPNAERVAILLLPPNLYGKNIPILRATALLNVKSLETMSFKVMHTSMEQLMNLPEQEMFPYLKQMIGLKKYGKNIDMN